MFKKSSFKPKGDGKAKADTHGHDAPLGPDHPHHAGGEGYHTLETDGMTHHISHHEGGKIHHSVEHSGGAHHMVHEHGQDTHLMDGNATEEELESPHDEAAEMAEETHSSI